MANKFSAALCLCRFLIIVNCTTCYCQDIIRNPVRIMFYNVENLFDVYNDSLKDDDEFLPSGTMRWNLSRYEKKISSLYKVIVAAGKWSPPEVVALCEVENRKVLNDIICGTYLSKYNYKIIHEESPDPRGIDVCLIYRADCISVLNYKYWIPQGINIMDYKTRSALYLKLSVESDTFHLIINHWPSRRGGVLAAEDLRMNIASMIKFRVDSILKCTDGRAKVLLLGDFNSSPDDKEMRFLTGGSGVENNFLVNLSEPLAAEGKGTYKYMGRWEMIDQTLVSGEFLTSGIGLYTDFKYVNIFSPDFLLVKDPVYPGFMPFSTYRGSRYNGGTSDHLPVLTELHFK
jgi:predicted extracellular nuclease